MARKRYRPEEMDANLRQTGVLHSHAIVDGEIGLVDAEAASVLVHLGVNPACARWSDRSHERVSYSVADCGRVILTA